MLTVKGWGTHIFTLFDIGDNYSKFKDQVIVEILKINKFAEKSINPETKTINAE